MLFHANAVLAWPNPVTLELNTDSLGVDIFFVVAAAAGLDLGHLTNMSFDRYVCIAGSQALRIGLWLAGDNPPDRARSQLF